MEKIVLRRAGQGLGGILLVDSKALSAVPRQNVDITEDLRNGAIYGETFDRP